MALTFLLSGVALATGFPPSVGATSDDATPQRIAGHEVLGVQNSDNLKCYSGPGPMVILAATSQSADILLSEDGPDFDAIKRALNDEGYSDETGIVLSGPGITKQMVEKQRLRWNRIREERGCIQFGGPQDLEEDQVSGGPAQSYAQINPNLQPGYSTENGFCSLFLCRIDFYSVLLQSIAPGSAASLVRSETALDVWE